MEGSLKIENIFSDIKVINNDVYKDNRGYFKKLYSTELNEYLNFEIDEVYFSKNKKNVVRGIHYQNKTNGLAKIVKCVSGQILDFFIDLRKESSSYGQHSSKIISEENSLSILVPYGFGHGFSVLSEEATVLYLQDGSYKPEAELGINPLSIDFDWRVSKPIVSDRDLNLPNFLEGDKQFYL